MKFSCWFIIQFMISILSKQSLFVIDARAAFLWRHNDQLLILSFNRLITTPTCPSSAFNCRRQTKSEEIRSKKASNFGVNNVMSCHRSFARIFNKFFSCRNSRGLDNWMWKGKAEKIRIQIGLAWKRRKTTREKINPIDSEFIETWQIYFIIINSLRCCFCHETK